MCEKEFGALSIDGWGRRRLMGCGTDIELIIGGECLKSYRCFFLFWEVVGGGVEELLKLLCNQKETVSRSSKKILNEKV